MTITSRYVPTAWAGGGALVLDADLELDARLDQVVDLMVATGEMPAGLDPPIRYGRAMSRVLRDGFESVMDALTLAQEVA